MSEPFDFVTHFRVWYGKKFLFLINLPKPWNFVSQFFLVLFYGFLWIPIWYFIACGYTAFKAHSDAIPEEEKEAAARRARQVLMGLGNAFVQATSRMCPYCGATMPGANISSGGYTKCGNCNNTSPN